MPLRVHLNTKTSISSSSTPLVHNLSLSIPSSTDSHTNANIRLPLTTKSTGNLSMPKLTGLCKTSSSLTLGSTKLGLANLNKQTLNSARSSGTSLSALADNYLQGKPTAPKLGGLSLLPQGLNNSKSGLLEGQLLPKGGILKLEDPTMKKSQTTLNSSLFRSSVTPSSGGLKQAGADISVLLEARPDTVKEPETMECTDFDTITSGQPVELIEFEEVVNEKLVSRHVSQLGRILCYPQSNNTSINRESELWTYESQLLLLHPSFSSKPEQAQQRQHIQPFDFSKPSPDDVILAKQHGAFTRTGASKGERCLPSADGYVQIGYRHVPCYIFILQAVGLVTIGQL